MCLHEHIHAPEHTRLTHQMHIYITLTHRREGGRDRGMEGGRQRGEGRRSCYAPFGQRDVIQHKKERDHQAMRGRGRNGPANHPRKEAIEKAFCCSLTRHYKTNEDPSSACRMQNSSLLGRVCDHMTGKAYHAVFLQSHGCVTPRGTNAAINSNSEMLLCWPGPQIVTEHPQVEMFISTEAWCALCLFGLIFP